MQSAFHEISQDEWFSRWPGQLYRAAPRDLPAAPTLLYGVAGRNGGHCRFQHRLALAGAAPSPPGVDQGGRELATRPPPLP
ncbi:MAG: hypothetical protein M3P34_02325, partial [Actinomycetota bacterium]|nr:hypothetical protein [Actinomycetota bacterium]